jgi:hypothetical protein
LKIRRSYNGFVIVRDDKTREFINIDRILYGTRVKKSKSRVIWLAPDVKWWDQLYDGKILAKYYEYPVSELEFNNDDYFALYKWSFKEFNKLKFFDKYNFIHELYNFVKKHAYKVFKYPDDVLRFDFQLAVEDNIKLLAHDGYIFPRYKNHGNLLFKNFFPYQAYNFSGMALNNRNNFNFLLLKAIYRIIDNNIQKDFNYELIMDSLAKLKYSHGKLHVFRPTCLYRAIINDLDLNGKSFFDFDPRCGEKFLASVIQGCQYYFRPTYPFDLYYKKFADFLNYEDISEYNESTRYDFSIVDFDFKFSMSKFEYYMNNHFKNIDTNIIYVNHKFVNIVEKKYPPHRKIPIKIYSNACYFFVYN